MADDIDVQFLQNNTNKTKCLVGVIDSSYMQTKIDAWIEMPINDNFIDDFGESLKQFQLHLERNRHFTCLLLNYRDFKDMLYSLTGYYQPQYKDTFDSLAHLALTMEDPFMEYTYVLLTEKLFNFISSAKMFLDYNEKIIGSKNFKDNYGVSIVEEYTRLRKNEYDNNIEYAILYDLRNYTQHQWFPPGVIRVTRSIKPSTENIKAEISYNIRRDEFLKTTNKTFNKDIKKRIEELESEFNIVPFIDKYFSCLKKLYLFTIRNENNLLVKSAKYTNVIMNYFKPYNVVPVVVYVFNQTNEMIYNIRIPFYMMHFLNEFLIG